jgi:hypothetical protein
MINCININDPLFKDIVAAFNGNEALARTAVALNNDIIPSVDAAITLIANMKSEENDERHVRHSDEFKLERTKDQAATLVNVSLFANSAQREAISKLLKNNREYQEFLEKNIELRKEGKNTLPSYSVTSFIGSSDFTGDPTKYEAFKLFGTFMHDVLEKAQVEALKTNAKIDEILTEEFFDNVYSKYLEKNPFYIEDLTKENIYKMAKDVAKHVSINNDEGYLILPEITLAGKDTNNNYIVGRLDLLLISNTGKVKVFDFKTKKVHNMVYKGLSNETIVDIDRAFVNLASTTYVVKGKQGMANKLRESNLNRTAYDNWTLQLKAYENMLGQIGLVAEESKIVALLYQTDANNKFLGDVLHIFQGDNYFDYARYAEVPGDNGFWKKEPIRSSERLEEYRQAIDVEIPIGDKKIEEELEKNFKNLEFTPTEEENKKVITAINEAYEQQSEAIFKKIKELDSQGKNTEPLRELLAVRRSTLATFKTYVDKVSNTDLSYEINFFNILNTVEDDLKKITDLSEESIKNFRKGNLDFFSADVTQLNEAFKKSKGMYDVIEALKSIINDVSKNPENNITPSSPVNQKLVLLSQHIMTIEANFREAGTMVGVKILMTPGEVVFTNVSKQTREALVPKIAELEKEIEDLRAGKAAGPIKQLKSAFLSFVSQDFKKKISEGKPETKILLDNIQRKELELIRLRTYVATGIEFNPEAIKKYINGVTDPNSQVYIGAQDTINSTSLFSGLLLDQGIASASNSDLAISAMTQMYKNAQARAVYNMQNDFAIMQFDKDRDELLKRFTVEELNDKISEWREYEDVDKSSGKVEIKRNLNFTKVYSEEYEKTFKESSSKLKAYNKEIRDLTTEANKKFSIFKDSVPGSEDFKTANEEYNIAKENLFNKKQERETYNTEHIKWMIDNCSLPFNESFYKLQALMPEEIRNELQEKYFEIQQITFQVGEGNEVLLEDYDFDRLKELEDDIRVLRQKAKKINPEYASYIEEFNNLFEFDTNFAFYERRKANAIAKFQEHPELLKKWFEDNTVTKPTSEWYEELSALYESRAEIFGSDPAVGDLLQKRSEILRPHKVSGILQSRFITEEESEMIAEIEAQLESIFEGKTFDMSTLTEEQKAKSKIIKQEIDRIASLQLTKSYINVRDAKVKSLYNSKKLLVKSQLELEKAKIKKDAAEITEKTKSVIFYEGEFDKEEKEFEKWYNQFHEQKYESILDSEEDIFKKMVPKSFNYQRLPAPSVASTYTESVPNPKYKIKKLKESSYNPNFLKSPDGIPMPKGVYQNSDKSYAIDRTVYKPTNVNSKYIAIMNDPELFSFYNKLTNMFFELQSKVDGKKIGYKVPGFASTLMQNFSREGVIEGSKNRWEQYIDKAWRTESIQDSVENTFGDNGGRIRLRFNDQLPENMQSKDSIGCLIKWVTEANYNIAMQEVTPMADTFLSYLELQEEDLTKIIQNKPVINDADGRPVDMNKRLTELKNVISILKSERRKFVNAQDQSLTYLNRKLTKMVNNVMSYTSFIRIGFDVVNQTKNYVSGNVQSFIAAGGLESDHYSKEDYMWAKGQVYGLGENGFIKNYFGDWGRISDISKSTMMYRLFNPAQKNYMKYVDEVTGSRGRRILAKTMNIQELGYLLQDKGDTEIAVTVMYAVLNHYKFKTFDIDPVTGDKVYKKDAEGNYETVSAHEVYFKDSDGSISRRADVEYTQEDENRLRNTIYSEMRRAQGNYAKDDRTAFEETVTGKLVFFFRKYLIPQFLNRFGYLRPNWESGEVAVGYWRAFVTAYRYYGPKEITKHLVLGSKKLLREDKSKMNTFYASKVQHAKRDAITMALFTVLGLMALTYVRKKDDDDEELSFLEGNAIRVLWGVQGETQSMFPIGGGSKEYVRNFTTFTAYTREFNAIMSTTNHGFNLLLSYIINGAEEPDENDGGWKYEIWKNSHYMRQAGGYEKGDAKLMKDFFDLTGIKNFRDIADPNWRIDIMKRNQ